MIFVCVQIANELCDGTYWLLFAYICKMYMSFCNIMKLNEIFVHWHLYATIVLSMGLLELNIEKKIHNSPRVTRPIYHQKF